MKFTQVAGVAMMAAAVLAVVPAGISRGQAGGQAVSARRALGQTVHELKVDGQSVGKVIDYLRDLSGANIVVNWKTLEAAGVAKETPVSLQVRELTLQKMLQLVLDQASPNAQLTFSVDSNVIQVTTQEDADKQMITKVYVVDDLVMPDNTAIQPPRLNLQSLTSNSSSGGGSGIGGNGGGGGGGFGSGGGNSGGSAGASGGLFTSSNQTTTVQPKQASDQKGQDLVALVREVIRPSIWVENGGPASIRYFSGKLIVTAPPSVQEAIGGPVGDSVGSVRFGN